MLSPAADVYSFGLVLLELYYGCSVGEITLAFGSLGGRPGASPYQLLLAVSVCMTSRETECKSKVQGSAHAIPMWPACDKVDR